MSRLLTFFKIWWEDAVYKELQCIAVCLLAVGGMCLAITVAFSILVIIPYFFINLTHPARLAFMGTGKVLLNNCAAYVVLLVAISLPVYGLGYMLYSIGKSIRESWYKSKAIDKTT